jgi:hypothetical protein
VDEAAPVPHRELVRLSPGLVGAVLFTAVSLIEGALRPDYDGLQQAVSALCLGPRGWIARINFVIFGAAVLSTCRPWHRVLAGRRGAIAYPCLLGVSGACVVVCGVVRQDPAPGYDPEALALVAPTALGLVHLGAAGIGIVSSMAGLLVLSSRFARRPDWRGWVAYTWAMAFATLVCVTVYAVWSVRPHGLAGTFERLAIVITPVWGFTLFVRLWRGAAL